MAVARTARRPSMVSWISEVPSKIWVTLASRSSRLTQEARTMPSAPWICTASSVCRRAASAVKSLAMEMTSWSPPSPSAKDAAARAVRARAAW